LPEIRRSTTGGNGATRVNARKYAVGGYFAFLVINLQWGRENELAEM
jgi:hypothetical protein